MRMVICQTAMIYPTKLQCGRNQSLFDHAEQLVGKVNRFEASMKESNDDMIEIGKFCFDLKCQRQEDTIKERAEDRKDRARERKLKREGWKVDREVAARLELEQFKIVTKTALSFQKKD